MGRESNMKRNYLLEYSKKLAMDIVTLCENIETEKNAVFQIKKSSSSVYANIREGNYRQSPADMVSKFEIALKEVYETEGWLEVLNCNDTIDDATYKFYRNLCGRIRRLLIASIRTIKTNHGPKDGDHA